jgi:xanthine dehydrogenase accessory factor
MERLADSFTQQRVDLLRRTGELAAASTPFALATVVRVEPPSSARPGNRAIVYRDGSIEGWIGGGCATPTVRRECLAALAGGEPRFVRITPDAASPAPENVIVAPMTCSSGGTIEVWIEPFLPAPALVIGGSSPVAHALHVLGASLGFRVVSYSPLDGDAVDEVAAIVAGLTAKTTLEPHETWLVAVSHGDFDDALVEAGIRLGFRYVGLVASERRARATRLRLHQHGFADEALGAFRPAAGLRIGAKTPEEIALSVMAEIVALRRSAEPRPTPPESGAEALDVICGMSVEIAGAAHHADHDGRRFYFCGAGCRRAFLADPAASIAATPA